MGLFVFDRLIDASEFCNFNQEREKLFNYIQNGHCVKLFAPRNFGKTSLIKNIVSSEWQDLNPEKRVVVYTELYSVRSLQDISAKFTQAFNKALSRKKSTRQLLGQLAKVLKSVRPTWKPPTDDSSFLTSRGFVQGEAGLGAKTFTKPRLVRCAAGAERKENMEQ